jgi:hypothetical protein
MHINNTLHTRIRTVNSALKDHLYKKYIEANPYCSCKLVVTSEHFLLKCSRQLYRGGQFYWWRTPALVLN